MKIFDQTSSHDLRDLAYSALLEPVPQKKMLLLDCLEQSRLAQRLELDPTRRMLPTDARIPGRPEKPELVHPLAVQKRAMHTLEGRAIAIHALAHIEFNAINLALDAIWRFSDMPQAYYFDWLLVAQEEALHFSLLQGHLLHLGYTYGSFPAHDSLWEMVEKTQGDVLARMALVPRTMEARGLDAVPQIRARFLQAKDTVMVNILDTILRDEIGHVRIGNHWFNYLCEERQLNPILVFAQLAQLYKAPQMKGPFNVDARQKAGFTAQELEILQGG